MTPSAIDIGQIVAGRYRVERILGRGGMGVVAAVRHLELDETFALKVMTPDGFASPEAVERFVREARTTAKLRSIHAVKVVDTGRLHDGAPFLVMEYLQGRDLEKELRARGPLPPAEVASYAIQTCDVLAEAHAAGVVHRDLKPANLFLTRLPNGTACIKVLDFGIAKQADASRGSSMTQTTSVFGTPLYMSPEQMKSAKSVDARSDIWSLGVVIYELSTGALPYDAESMTALVAKVMTEPPVPLRHRRPGLPPAFEQVVGRCLERDPARRYASAAELAAALAPFAAGMASRASVPDFGSQSFGPIAAVTGPSPSYGAHGAVPPPTFGNAATQMAVSSHGRAGPRGGSKVPLLAFAAVLAVASAISVMVALRGSGEPSTTAAEAATATAPPPPETAPVVVPASPTETPAIAAPAPTGTSSAAPTATAATAAARPTAAKPTTKPATKPTASPAPTPAKSRGGFL